jgi:hypothetical protein
MVRWCVSTGIALTILCSLLQPSAGRAAEMIQHTTATFHGVQLPADTNQVVEDEDCRKINETNTGRAPSFGYHLDSGAGDFSTITYSDPATGISVTQSCLPASLGFDPLPRRPLSGRPPPNAPVNCPNVTAWTLVLYVVGQSNAANNVESRYTASDSVFVSANGTC